MKTKLLDSIVGSFDSDATTSMFPFLAWFGLIITEFPNADLDCCDLPGSSGGSPLKIIVINTKIG